MPWLSSKATSLLKNYQENSNGWHLCLITLLTTLRVITSRTLDCPAFFDCNSYIHMVNNWGPDSEVAGHHAMRILPAIVVWLMTQVGASVQLGFQILSGSAYILFGVLLYGFLSQQNITKQLAFAVTLLALAPHEAMRVPLQLVYQSCDILVYPITLLLIHSSLQKRLWPVCLLSLVGILVRQNMFILGALSIIYCMQRSLSLRALMALLLLIACYSALQIYYQASGTFVQLLSPPDGFFTLTHLQWVIVDSKILELFVPMLPFLIFFLKPILSLVVRYWHVSLYVCITMGQPFLGYHLTGNNFARLALQGAWIFYLAIAMIWPLKWQRPYLVALTVFYALGVYFTWGLKQRIWMMIGLLCLFVLFAFIQKPRVHYKGNDERLIS